MKAIGRRDPEEAPPFAEYWDGFVELALALSGGGFPVPRGVWRFSTYEEEKEWEDRMLLGEAPGAGPQRKKT
ncbi:hypothetical protein [Ammonifex thiophilus]|uniref:Uncharacterized protein n=1 Tax=Ammonifex thiophilus TaxID=444093 RepID=A0A3D8P0T2_9THEO|nr:hypothetical protein [Ammonifex thiophilus]RDV80736.1 hypothetical protein DXX99_10410 [Ammonifex thiophilus]